MRVLDAVQFSIDFFHALSEQIKAKAKMRRGFAMVTSPNRPALTGHIETHRLLAILEGVERNMRKDDPQFSLSPSVGSIGDAVTPAQVSAWILQISICGDGRCMQGQPSTKIVKEHYGCCWTCLAQLLAGPVTFFFQALHTGDSIVK